MKKGLSPVIATVLLIAVVISLSAIVFFWARGFLPEVISKGNFGTTKDACGQIKLFATFDSATGMLQITNNGNVPIFSFNVLAESGDNFGTKEFSSPIMAGNSDEFDLGGTVSAPDNIEITPFVLGEGAGKNKVYICDNTFTASIQ